MCTLNRPVAGQVTGDVPAPCQEAHCSPHNGFSGQDTLSISTVRRCLQWLVSVVCQSHCTALVRPLVFLSPPI